MMVSPFQTVFNEKAWLARWVTFPRISHHSDSYWWKPLKLHENLDPSSVFFSNFPRFSIPRTILLNIFIPACAVQGPRIWHSLFYLPDACQKGAAILPPEGCILQHRVCLSVQFTSAIIRGDWELWLYQGWGKRAVLALCFLKRDIFPVSHCLKSQSFSVECLDSGEERGNWMICRVSVKVIQCLRPT